MPGPAWFFLIIFCAGLCSCRTYPQEYWIEPVPVCKSCSEQDSCFKNKIGKSAYYTLSCGKTENGKWNGRRADYTLLYSGRDTAVMLERICHFKKGVLHGEYRMFSIRDSSKLQWKGVFTNGKRTGIWTEYNVMREWPLEGDSVKENLDNKITTVFKNGKIDQRYSMKRGLFGRHREYIYFDSCDVIKEIRKYRRAYKPKHSMNCIIKPRSQRAYSKPCGKWKYYNTQGKLLEKKRPAQKPDYKKITFE